MKSSYAPPFAISASALLASCVFLQSALADDAGGAKPDKSGYSLFNPTPNDQLRDFSPDRPGKAHNTSTVDAGRFQVESDIVNLTLDPHGVGNVSTRSITIGAPLFKVGVTNWLDFEVGLSLYNTMRQFDPTQVDYTATPPATGVMKARGFGDTLFGAKANIFGNEGGDQSLALLGFVKAPTARGGLGNGYAEYSFNLPFTTALANPWSLTLEPTFAIVRNFDDTRYTQNLGFIANLSRPILITGLTGVIEMAVNHSLDDRQGTQLSFDPSLQYVFAKDFQIDAGVYLGLTKVTPRYNPYVGFAHRF